MLSKICKLNFNYVIKVTFELTNTCKMIFIKINFKMKLDLCHFFFFKKRKIIINKLLTYSNIENE